MYHLRIITLAFLAASVFFGIALQDAKSQQSSTNLSFPSPTGTGPMPLTFPQIFNKTENSVVQVISENPLGGSLVIRNGEQIPHDDRALGSGFVYDQEGHIITNNHVISDPNTVEVTFVDGDSFPAKVIGKDPYSDIAVLQITDGDFQKQIQPLKAANSSALQVGEEVVAIGNPFGLSGTLTSGVISQIGRVIPNDVTGYSIANIIQTDAAINPGNSGGPLLNMEGEVIGINTAIKSNTGDFAGIGFATPSNIIKKIVPTLIVDGKYSHPWLGITGTSLNSDLAESLNLPKNYKGVVVSQVIKDGPAEKAGLHEATYNASGELKSADVIISLDGNQINEIDDVIIYIFEEKNVGDEILITINRDGKIFDLQTILQERLK